MSKIYTKSSEEFEFVKCAETKKVEEALSYWLYMTQRPIDWDFDLNGNFAKFDKRDIRSGLAKIITIGGLKAGIIPIKNEKNRVSSYFVWTYQVSDKWKEIPGNTIDGCVKKLPDFDAESLIGEYKKFTLAKNLESELNSSEITRKKIKI